MNPFRPTAGKMPPVLIGREADIADFHQGLVDGAGAPGRLMLVTGQRGYGKTVLLTELCRVAASEGWMVVSETASDGMCARIVDALVTNYPHVKSVEIAPSVKMGNTISASLGSISLEQTMQPRSLRLAINERLERCAEGKGVLIALDEVQAASHADMVAVGTAIQHVIRDQDLSNLPDSKKRGVAFAFAGLPFVMDELLDNESILTFLRRAQRHVLGPIAIPDIRNAFELTITEHGKRISEGVAWEAAKQTKGFPYMVQLIGYYLWQAAETRRSVDIDGQDLARAVPDAIFAFQDSVCAPTWRALTKAQRSFLVSMLPDGGRQSVLADIAKRSARSLSWARKYRRSLMESQVVAEDGDGTVSYDIPYLEDYLHRIDVV